MDHLIAGRLGRLMMDCNVNKETQLHGGAFKSTQIAGYIN